jgi:hypothetical protein
MLDEFTFRLNEGSVKIHTLDRIDSLLEKSVGTRITYKQLGKFQKGVKYIIPFFMRMTAGPCPRTPSFPDFHQEFFFARLRPDSAPARMTGLNLLCAVALPGMIYPEDTAFKSTRPPEPGSPATDLRRWGGASGDPVRD